MSPSELAVVSWASIFNSGGWDALFYADLEIFRNLGREVYLGLVLESRRV